MFCKRIIRKRNACALLGGAAVALLGSPLLAQSPTTNPLVTGKRITQPPLGPQTPVGSLPMNMILTPDGRFAITSDMGFHQLLTVLDTRTGRQVSSLEFGNPMTRSNPGLYFGLALAPSQSGSGYTLYASQGGNHTIGVLNIDGSGALTPTGTIPMQGGDFPAGVAVDGRGYLYVAVNQNYSGGTLADAITPARLVVYNTAAPGVITATLPTTRYSPAAPASPETARLPLGPALTAADPANAQPAYSFTPPSYPYAVAATAGGKVYVSSQRDDAVYVFTTNGGVPTLSKTITSGAASGTQAHPVALLLNAAQTKLFVAYAHGEKVAVVDTGSDAVLSSVSLLPAGASGLFGFTPTGLGLSPDESRLYVSLGDANAVAVVNLAAGSVSGYIPAGWYPGAVVASPFKNLILVANAKGTKTRNPNPAFQYSGGRFLADANGSPTTMPNNIGDNADPNYGLYLTVGNVETIPVPNSVVLARDTQMVLDNNRLGAIGTATATSAAASNPLAPIGLKAGGIKHIVYIVKENRTYDQVLGDEPGANGDPALAIFGSKTGVQVTPNQHALAERFVLLDNFYDCGEASGDGWPWSTQGQANEAVIKDLPYNYSGRGRNYDYEGSNNNYPTGGFPATDPYGQPLVGPASPFYLKNAPPITDVSEAPGGHIWDDLQRSLDLTGTGLTTKYRNYGFFTSFGVTDKNGLELPSNLPGSSGLQPAGHDLGGLSDFDMRGYDQNFADSEASYFYAYGAFPATPAPMAGYPVQPDNGSTALFSIQTFGHYNSPSRVSEFKREFAEMLAQDPSGGAVPAFIMLKYSNDHTQGYRTSTTNPRIHSPRSGVADNDYAVGQTVDLLSHSPVWNNTAIFVIEDDAQDGPDHVDAHRSTCYVLSPYIKRSSVDHTFYNTDSVLKTMEVLLNLPPMSQYDAVATPILDFDIVPNNSAPYTAVLPPRSLIQEVNPSMTLVKRGSAAQRRLAELSNKMDFVHPDSAPPALLNEIIWKSVKGVHSKMPAPRHNAAIEARLHLTQPTANVGAKAAKPARDGDD